MWGHMMQTLPFTVVRILAGRVGPIVLCGLKIYGGVLLVFLTNCTGYKTGVWKMM